MSYFYNFIFINLFFIIISNVSSSSTSGSVIDSTSTTTGLRLFINQSDNINIIAKLGHTIHLPCLIYKTTEQSNVNVVWSKLNEKLRTKVLTIGLQQLTFDMRYRIKIKTTTVENDEHELLNKTTTTTTTETNVNDMMVENWQLEIRKVTYEDTGLYQCSLPLVNPIYKNITLKIIPDLIIHPKKAIYAPGQHIHLKCHTNLTLQHRKMLKSGLLQVNEEILKWYKDSKHLKTSVESSNTDSSNDKSSVIVKTQLINDNILFSELIVNNIDYEDTAVYRCVYEGIQEKSVISVHNSAHKLYFIASSSNSLVQLNILNIVIAIIFSFYYCIL